MHGLPNLKIASGVCQTDTAHCLLAGTRWNCSFIIFQNFPSFSFLTFIGPCIVIYFCSKTNEMHHFFKFSLFCSRNLHNLNKNTNYRYFFLKSLKLYLHYSGLHVSDTIVSIIRSFSAEHAVSVPVWCF